MNRTEIAGKVALITGAASGVGAATARHLAALGATVICADVDEANGLELARELGEPHRFVTLDVTDAERWEEVVADATGDLGRLDIVFLNAGVMARSPTEPVHEDPIRWLNAAAHRKVSRVNVDGVVYGLVAALPQLEAGENGAVVITSSSAGLEPFTQDPLYTMTKHALLGLGRAMAPALAKRGITINVICPMSVDTPIVPQDYDRSKLSPPSYVAECLVTILASGETGGVWVAPGEGREPWLHDFGSPLARDEAGASRSATPSGGGE